MCSPTESGDATGAGEPSKASIQPIMDMHVHHRLELLTAPLPSVPPCLPLIKGLLPAPVSLQTLAYFPLISHQTVLQNGSFRTIL